MGTRNRGPGYGTFRRGELACGTAVIAAAAALLCGNFSRAAEEPASDSTTAALAELVGVQQMLELPVRVVDADGQPVAKAKVTPWALRSSQGHGLWVEDDKRAGVGPQEVHTDEDGVAKVLYPRYRDVQEQVRTLSVSLYIDHPEFAYVDDLHIDVPLETDGPYEAKLTRGVPVEIRPLVDGKPTELDDVLAMWSDGRFWQPGAPPEQLADGTLRIPAMPPGENSVLLAKLDGERATHFSKIIDFELEAGEPKRIDVPMQPAKRIEGELSDNVPRPVRNGRVKVRTLPPTSGNYERVLWYTWAPIRPDGSFTIDGWPAEEPLQLIALCEGYTAVSGKAPDVVENPRDPKDDPFQRPQVFDPKPGERIEVAMTPLVPCSVTAVDENGEPVAGVKVSACPNVGWWNGGSQIYCYPLERCERLLRTRDYQDAVDKAFPYPFESTTDAQGKTSLELPAGTEDLRASSDDYELPVFIGHRDVRVTLVPGETAEVTLRLQPGGTDKLGEWDKLAGVVFGCSTSEGRRICALPGVRKQMEEFAKRFRESSGPPDPQLLAEAYAAVADAFLQVGDVAEANKWRRKSAEQAAKAPGAEPAVAD